MFQFLLFYSLLINSYIFIVFNEINFFRIDKSLMVELK